MEKFDKIRHNFGTSDSSGIYYMRNFVVPKLSQFTPVSVEEIPKNSFEVSIQVMYVTSFTHLTTEIM